MQREQRKGFQSQEGERIGPLFYLVHHDRKEKEKRRHTTIKLLSEVPYFSSLSSFLSLHSLTALFLIVLPNWKNILLGLILTDT